MKRHALRWFALLALVTAPLGAQQPLRGGEPMPAGHPPVAAPAPAASAPATTRPPPSAHAPAAAGNAEELPSGHPPVAAAPRPQREPEFSPPPDRSVPDKELPVGSVRARIVDAKEAPLAGLRVRLGILRQTIAEGESRDERTATTDAEGWVRFDGMKPGSDFSYRVTVPHGAATYASTPFNLSREAGQSVLLHVYPVVREVNQALVGMRGYVSVEPRDDVFQFEAMYQIFNLGAVTWVPNGVTLDLPPGYKAAKGGDESMSDVRFEPVDGRGLELQGTISPGQHSVTFRFQVPREGGDSATFRLSLPPHVAEQQVITASAPGMTLAVDGFPSAQPATSNTGQRLLGTARRMHQGEAALRELIITLTGIPGPGPARWVAAAIAAAIALGGLSFAWQQRAAASASRVPVGKADAEQAKEVLLAELVALEAAHAEKQIGPRTYESARRSLLDALVRLEAALGTFRDPSLRHAAG